MQDDHRQKLIEELSGVLDRAVEILKEIKEDYSPNHEWVKKEGRSLNGNPYIWWHCKKCLLTPTMVKPHLPDEDMPLKSPCPGPALFAKTPKFSIRV